MRAGIRGKDGMTGWFIYIFVLIGYFLAYWILKDLGMIADLGVLYNTAFTVVITILAFVTAGILKRNMKKQGGDGGFYNG